MMPSTHPRARRSAAYADRHRQATHRHTEAVTAAIASLRRQGQDITRAKVAEVTNLPLRRVVQLWRDAMLQARP